MKRSIYLDHAATTPLHPEVLQAMLPYLSGHFGNPSGAYALGRQAAKAVNEARSSVAEVLGCRTREVVFTGAVGWNGTWQALPSLPDGEERWENIQELRAVAHRRSPYHRCRVT